MKNIQEVQASAIKRDGSNTSLWQHVESPLINTHPSSSNHYDVIIIGAGITGLTTAILLQEAGKNCIILDHHAPAFGTSGGTTAHLNTYFDTSYPQIEKDFGEDAAKLVAQSGKESIQLVKDLIDRYTIDCDFNYLNGFLYAEDEKQAEELNEILSASKKAGIDVEKAESNHLPIPFQDVICFHHQAQFHPVKYLAGLTKAFQDLGGIIKLNTFVDEAGFDEGFHFAKSGDIKMLAHQLVHATHYPQGINLFNFTCAPYRSYAIAVKLEDENYPDALAYDMQEPYHYFRTHTENDEKYLIVGGADHKTGHGNPEESFDDLIAYVTSYYNIKEITHKWSSQYYIPADGLPYIGHFTGQEEGTYVATGYNGNGMTFGTLAGLMISDDILGKENKFKDLFNPSRIKPIAGFKEFVKENSDVAWRFIKDRISSDNLSSLQEIENGQASLITHDGKKIAVYKDEQGNLHALQATCTHAGCIVNWNAEEKSWDCPCHGGRFDIDGHVLAGPPKTKLQKVKIE